MGESLPKLPWHGGLHSCRGSQLRNAACPALACPAPPPTLLLAAAAPRPGGGLLLWELGLSSASSTLQSSAFLRHLCPGLGRGGAPPHPGPPPSEGRVKVGLGGGERQAEGRGGEARPGGNEWKGAAARQGQARGRRSGGRHRGRRTDPTPVPRWPPSRGPSPAPRPPPTSPASPLSLPTGRAS